MSFTPDATQLVVVARYAGAIHRWDLRAIRERLKTMNLDWDWPEFPAARRIDGLASNARTRMRLEILSGKPASTKVPLPPP
jgi:hypothetical protein